MGLRERLADFIDPSRKERFEQAKDITPAEVEDTAGGHVHSWAWNDWDAERAHSDGFLASTYVFACIDKIATSVATASIVIERQTSNGEWERAEHEKLRKLIDNPNPHWTGDAQRYLEIASWLIAGDSFVTKLSVSSKSNPPPDELWYHLPQNVRVLKGKDRLIAGYAFGKDKTNEKRISPNRMVHGQSIPDPLNPYQGLTPLRAMAREVDVDVKSLEWQWATFKNNALPSGVIQVAKDMPTKELKKLRRAIDNGIQGVENARKIMIVQSDSVDFKPFTIPAKELDFLNSRKMTREGICTGFKVPPPVVGIYENATLANIETAREIFWVDTVIPEIRKWLSIYNKNVASYWKGYRYNVDLSNVDALVNLFAKKVEIGERLFKMGWPANEINRRLGLGMTALDTNVGYVPANLIPSDLNDPAVNL